MVDKVVQYLDFKECFVVHANQILFLAGRYYLSGTLVSANVLCNVVPPLIKKVSSVADVDVGTCHPSVCEIPLFKPFSACS
jgi:hypothetical protein